MLSKFKKNCLIGLASLALISSASALEPLKERARLHDLNGYLLLPDSSYLSIDMSFDCGSQWANTALIVTSEAGAELLAASYTHLWGAAAGKMVMHTWNNKANPDDPRLPTFLIVTPPAGTNFKWQKSVAIGSKSKFSQSTINNDDIESHMPVVTASCGTRVHSNYPTIPE